MARYKKRHKKKWKIRARRRIRRLLSVVVEDEDSLSRLEAKARRVWFRELFDAEDWWKS